jgi:hypothetical protein
MGTVRSYLRWTGGQLGAVTGRTPASIMTGRLWFAFWRALVEGVPTDDGEEALHSG